MERGGNNLVKKIALVTVLILVFSSTSLFAQINVDSNDINIFKDNFADKIIIDINNMDQSDSEVYSYLISVINSSWSKYKTIPLFLYLDDNGEESYLTINPGDDLFDEDFAQFLEVESKARFLKFIYSSMEDIDLSATKEPAWAFISIQNENRDVVYLLEINIGNNDYKPLENGLVDSIVSMSLANNNFLTKVDDMEYMVTIGTYVAEDDELVVNSLFADEEGNVGCEGIIIITNILE